MKLDSHLTQLFINNQASYGTLISDQIPIAGEDDIDRAIEAAQAAFSPKSEWRVMSDFDRQKALLKFADLIEANREQLASLTRVTLGAPYNPFGKSEVDTAIGCFRYYAGWVGKFAGQSFPANDGFYKVVRHEPLGVVAGIIPWNGPLASIGLKAAPALATGNVFILKPSEKTPFAAAALGNLAIEAGFPPGVFQVLTGDGSTGAILASHMKVSKVSFTGSVATGKNVQILAAKSNLKRVTLELGGKSPAVVFDDANLENAVQWCVNALTTNSGQICFAASRRLLLQRERKMGDPEKATSEIGPVVDQAQYDRILEIINTAKREKQGTLVQGAGQKHSKGFYIEPAIFLDTDVDASITRDEIFGPVVVINRFKTEEEVVALSNDSRYGLMAGVFTQDISRALRLSEFLDSGVVGVNCVSVIHFSCPFGGTKESGIGRELGVYALHAYTEPKTVLINMNS
ncbi:hypothetical protein N7509_004658 [Penicillium cosmopolitanum]|uniref:aldehyde dehydrogenase (NAD(+)) n=1 Tax=Penicillium cosmopolitanum TaxID=1131564 RepID=A0A9W9W0Q8_9EURO|nr:uncharacterized protein N7509_004658 [Penicillium cosmopolitanum]KAJ5396545.1 hypothetical protein N7509_004658 [Penicillium cosmopolitanum]